MCEGYDLGICIGGVIELSFVVVRLVSNWWVVCVVLEYLYCYGVLCMLDDLV